VERKRVLIASGLWGFERDVRRNDSYQADPHGSSEQAGPELGQTSGDEI